MTQFADDFGTLITSRDEDEGLFSRDVGGQLVRLDAPTENDYDKKVSITIDGQSITVPLAEPLKDAQGNIVLDIDGKSTPRYTTIYDAATKLYGDKPKNIPILCHQPHMQPVAVCRMCVVQIYGQKRGKRAAERKLLPACQHQVKDKMEVFTMNAEGPDGDRVRKAVNVMTELLTADHLKDPPSPAPKELSEYNELKQVADVCGLKGSRFSLDVLQTPPIKKTRTTRGGSSAGTIDQSSPVWVVDHSACILCERCMRACDEVKQNNVIGRTGKGRTAGISFDLNDPMGESTCVQCGECMVSCPTSAITFKPVAKVKISGNQKVEAVPAGELVKDELFAEVPPKFLLWQEGLVTRQKVSPGEVLCKQGDPGNTAFLVKSGEVEVKASAPKGASAPAPFKLSPSGKDPLILGEMACLSGTPRTADVRATGAGEIWQIRRNVLDRIMRSPRQRARFEKMYRERALDVALRNGEVFEGLPEAEFKKCVDFLRPKISFVRVNPNQLMFRQGDWADALYLVRLGHVKIAINRFGSDAAVIHRGPGAVVGEIGLLAIAPEDMKKSVDELDKKIASSFADVDASSIGMALPSGQRTATCLALDHLELARVDRSVFLQMVRDFPSVRRRLIDMAVGRLKGENLGLDGTASLRREYVEQGLYQGQSLLVMDLHKCTHCDECVKACVQQHGTESHGVPVTRLIRDGLRIDNYLVAASCRSCKDAYCMIGCPVDSIHRGKHQQIVIEDHCIGCGLCAANCPFGNISMPENVNRMLEVPDAENPQKVVRIAQRKASTCDLCDAHGDRENPLPRCVYACPHDAAHRMTGDELLKEVAGRVVV